MRIAQVAPLIESVPPRTYGGTERVVSYLTEALVERGHEVTLFASGDSVTRARLVACCERSLRLDPGCKDALAHHVVMLERVFARRREFDLVHFHVDYLHYPFSRRAGTAHVTTLHGRLDLPDLVPLYREFPDVPVVSISDAQREPLPFARWVGTVHHGLPRHLYRPGPGGGGYLAFLGRLSPEKGFERADEIAARAGLPLVAAAKVDAADRGYFRDAVEPLLARGGVEYVGEVDDRGKEGLLGAAEAVLFPIDWPEPFGLVMIEAMACGTPVVAWRRGSVAEVLEDGVTGRQVASVEEAAAAVEEVRRYDRRAVRAAFEARFLADRMARDYEALYRALAAEHAAGAPHAA